MDVSEDKINLPLCTDLWYNYVTWQELYSDKAEYFRKWKLFILVFLFKVNFKVKYAFSTKQLILGASVIHLSNGILFGFVGNFWYYFDDSMWSCRSKVQFQDNNKKYETQQKFSEKYMFEIVNEVKKNPYDVSTI